MPFLICSSGLSAATANQTGTDQEIEQLIKGDGIEIAGFLLTPGAAVSAEYDSNLFATRTEEIDDTLFVYRPSLGLISDWQRHEEDMGYPSSGGYDSSKPDSVIVVDGTSGDTSGSWWDDPRQWFQTGSARCVCVCVCARARVSE